MRNQRSVVASFVVVPVAAVVLITGCGAAPGESTEASSSEYSTSSYMVADSSTPPACTLAAGNQVVVNPSPGCAPYGDWSQGEYCVSGSDANALHWQNGLGCAFGSPAYGYCLMHYGPPTIVNEVCVHVAQSCPSGGGDGGVTITSVPAPPCNGGKALCSCCTCGSCSLHN